MDEMDIKEDYRAFWRMMEECEGKHKVTSDFDGVCALIGADPDLLDPFLYEELGCTGEQIMAAYGLLSCN